MIPSRSRLAGWAFGQILSGAESTRIRGENIETAGSGIQRRCEELPTLNAWEGRSHSAAVGAFGRANGRAVVVGNLADGLASAMTEGYWSLSAAKRKLTSQTDAIEEGPFSVHDKWVVTIKPAEMTQEQANALMARRDALQAELNPLVTEMGNADLTTAQTLLNAAVTEGFTMERSTWTAQIVDTLNGLAPPTDDVPNPMTWVGLRTQRAIADADAAVTIASTETGVNGKGEPTKTVYMQDGSKRVFTETSFGPHYDRTAVTRQEDFDPSGQLVSTTETSPWGDDGAMQTTIRFAKDQTLISIITSPDGRSTATVYPEGKSDRAIPADSQLLSHPALTSMGGVMSGVETHAARVLEKPLPTLTTNTYQNLHAGMKFGGLALASGIALYDVATADNPQDKCRAAIAGAASVAGGWGAGALMASSGVGAVATGAVAAGGSWVFGWIGSEVGKAVCY